MYFTFERPPDRTFKTKQTRTFVCLCASSTLLRSPVFPVSLKARSPITFLWKLLPHPPPTVDATLTCHILANQRAAQPAASRSCELRQRPQILGATTAWSCSVFLRNRWSAVLIEVDGLFFFPPPLHFFLNFCVVTVKSKMFYVTSANASAGSS